MAAPIYCTHKELKRVFPQLDSFDGKKPVYGWTTTDTTNQYQANNTGLITQLYFDGVEGTAVTDSPNALYEFNYSSTTDSVQIFLTTSGGGTLDPNDILIEAGEDFTSVVTQFRTDASRYLDSMLDPNMPKEAWKDKDGNFDYIIIRTTALLAANFMIKSHDPSSELANALMDEAMNNIANINAGKAALSWQVTRDSSQGVVRDVVYNTAGAIRPVDTRGEWVGTYDLIKVIITTGGALGTAKYSVFTKDNVKLKNNESVSNEIIIGDYQPLAGGLEIRFAGSSDAIQNDEWEIECFGRYEDVDASTGKAVKMTRIRTYRGY
tara:strand:+ start:17 stop:982 length:966 start_codon:yes stop_codon:yes gene_type:complete